MAAVSHPSAADAPDVERLRRIVADAWDATTPVAEHVDSETRQTAFTLLLEAMLHDGQGARPTAERTMVAEPRPAADAPIDRAFATEVQRTDALATALGLEYGEVQSLFDLGAPEPVLRLNPTKLAPDSAGALREITLLVSVGRGALGLDTGTRHVREAAAAHDRLDAASFNADMELIPDIVLRGHPDGDNRYVGLRGAGFEAAGDLARRLVRE